MLRRACGGFTHGERYPLHGAVGLRPALSCNGGVDRRKRLSTLREGSAAGFLQPMQMKIRSDASRPKGGPGGPPHRYWMRKTSYRFSSAQPIANGRYPMRLLKKPAC